VALLSVTGEDQALDSLDGGTVNVLAFVSCHTGTTGTSGTNEYSGVTRQACSWNAAGSGAKTNSTALTFTTDGLTPVTHLGTFSASTSGTFGIGSPLGASVTAVTVTVASGADSLTAS
jgi:hypothetical protein